MYVAYKSRVGRQLTDICSNTGVWLTVTFTVERYISVCFPMKAIVWCTPRRARHIIIAVCVCAAGLTLPEFFATTATQVSLAARAKVYQEQNSDKTKYTCHCFVFVSFPSFCYFTFADSLVIVQFFGCSLPPESYAPPPKLSCCRALRRRLHAR